MVGYFEEQAVISYGQYLEQITNGGTDNIPAPTIAIEYYGLKKNATLIDVVTAVKSDEEGHSIENHRMADLLKETNGEPLVKIM